MAVEVVVVAAVVVAVVVAGVVALLACAASFVTVVVVAALAPYALPSAAAKSFNICWNWAANAAIICWKASLSAAPGSVVPPPVFPPPVFPPPVFPPPVFPPPVDGVPELDPDAYFAMSSARTWAAGFAVQSVWKSPKFSSVLLLPVLVSRVS